MCLCEILITRSDEAQAYVAEVPGLPGCFAFGDSPDEARENCQEEMAARFYWGG
jgi:predicted RNase H-like HicB family nuclease